MKAQKELLDKIFSLLDTESGKYGKVSLMSGVAVKDIIALDKLEKKLNEKDFKKLEDTYEIFKE